MNFPFYIATRYLFSKKSRNVINIISGVSVTGIAVGTMALVVVMSAFNGLEALVESLYSSFDPEIKITAKAGKTFHLDDFSEHEVKQIEGVKYYCKAIEEAVYLEYRKRDCIAKIKGVDEEFVKMTHIDSAVVEGKMMLKRNGFDYGVMGYGISYLLSVFVEDAVDPIMVYAAKRSSAFSATDPQSAFTKKPIIPAGVFSINQDFDATYMLVPFDFAEELLGYSNEVNSIEIGISDHTKLDLIKAQIKNVIGEKYDVKTRYELNELIFKTNKTEKWITYMILTFILIIATFNVIGSLVMLILDKKRDISILKSMGASEAAIRRIFLLEGMMITTLGGAIGLLVGFLLVIGQQLFGFVSLEAIIVEYYPVKLVFTDFILVMITVLIIGFVASWIPVKFITINTLNNPK